MSGNNDYNHCTGPRSQTEQLLEARLEATRQKLRQQVRSTVDREKQLASLGTFSARLAQSEDRQQVIDAALDLVRNVMAVEIVFMFIIDDAGAELEIAGSRGLSSRFSEAVATVRFGKGFNGSVAENGRSIVVHNVSADERMTKEDVRAERMQSMVIVPLIARSKITGTLGVATRRPRTFLPSDVSLLETIGNQIGIVIENCRLYSEQRETVRQLQISEKKYRLLFENAHDAIWVTDLHGRVIAANKACGKMVGRCPEELILLPAAELLASDQPGPDEERERAARGEFVEEVHDQRLTRTDGSELILKVATTSVVIDGRTIGYQHVAKDMTEERRMHDNLRFYVQQVTNAQEEERLRIARELHDSTAQALIAVLHQLETYLENKKGLSMTDSRFLWGLQEQIKSALHEVRQFSRDLRPSILDDLGLLPALEWLVDELRKHNHIDSRLSVFGKKRRFAPEAELTLFRIVQEGLRNIVRHANATKAEVTLVFAEDETKVIIKDNGQGLELPVSLEDLPRVGKLGLAGMRERAQLLRGVVTIESAPGRGTMITIAIPRMDGF